MKGYRNLTYLENFDTIELVAFSFYIMLIFLFSKWTIAGKIKKNPEYVYYLPGLLAKLFAGVAFCFMYVYYYKGGDTIAYFESGRAFANLFLDRPADFFKIYFSAPSHENYFLFTADTGYPWEYMYLDSRTFWVIRIITPLLIVGFNSYLISTILLAWVSFLGAWKLFKLFYSYYPHLYKQLALATLFIPSVLFWGSGILKDTITLSALCLFVYSFDNIFFRKKNRVLNVLISVFTFYLVILIKPYIIIALIPGSLAWISMHRIRKIKNKIFRIMAIPFIYILFFGLGFFALNALGSKMGKFSLDKMLETAAITQQDLKKDYYGGNRFDIGDFEASASGVTQKIPNAITAGLFRPFIWESKNIVMLFSGLENLFLLVMTGIVLFKLKISRIVRIMMDNPILIFAISYSILFAFSIGLTTANFGALIRFKIAFLPFFLCPLFVLYSFIPKKTFR